MKFILFFVLIAVGQYAEVTCVPLNHDQHVLISNEQFKEDEETITCLIKLLLEPLISMIFNNIIPIKDKINEAYENFTEFISNFTKMLQTLSENKNTKILYNPLPVIFDNDDIEEIESEIQQEYNLKNITLNITKEERDFVYKIFHNIFPKKDKVNEAYKNFTEFIIKKEQEQESDNSFELPLSLENDENKDVNNDETTFSYASYEETVYTENQPETEIIIN